MKHVCIVTSAHPYDDVRVASRIMTSFVDAGCRVTWVGPERTLSAAADVKRPGIDYRLFPTGDGRVDRLRGAARAMKLAKDVSDVDWWYSPDPDVAAQLPRLARRGGRTLFDVHESYHGGLLDRWFPGKTPSWARELLRRRIERTCSRIDLVMGVSSAVLDAYTSTHPNVVVVRNLAPAWFAAEAKADQPEVEGHRMRMLHGKLSHVNGTHQVVAAAGELPGEVQSQIEIVILDVESTLPHDRQAVEEARAQQAGDPVTVRPGVPHDQMAALMTSCDVGLIAYQRDLGHESLPNRLFEYMASGLAIVAPSYSPEIVKILDAEQIGLTADFEDPTAIAGALRWCVEHPDEVTAMGERAKKAYAERYTWDVESAGLISALEAF